MTRKREPLNFDADVFLIDVVIGDYHGKVHGDYSISSILSNLTQIEIIAAYQIGSEKIGFDLIRDVATKEGERFIKKDIVKKLVDSGYTSYKSFKLNPNEDFYLDPLLKEDIWFDIWSYIVELGNPSFTFTFSEPNPLELGGIGLFE
jgi:hypothetical protein